MIIGIALTASLAIGAYYVRTLHVALDEKTNCPATGPRAIHMVLIDRSDPISEQQAQRIRQWMQLLRDGASAGTRFDIYTFEGDSKKELRPSLSICATEREADPLYQNVKKSRERYDVEFAAVLERAVADLLQTGTRPTSPIIESLRAAALTSFGLVGKSNIPLRVTLISDLVQHSPALSHLRTNPDFDQLSRNSNWASLRPDLRGAEVEILYVLRPSAVRNSSAVQNMGHQQFWNRLIAASGGSVTEFTPF
jgi:hypothetical protein